MRYLRPLFIKYLLIALILALILPLFSPISVMHTFVLAVPVSLILFTLGDLTLFPRLGNERASLINGLLATLILLSSSRFGFGFPLTEVGILLSSLLIAINEWFFHHWLIQES